MQPQHVEDEWPKTVGPRGSEFRTGASTIRCTAAGAHGSCGEYEESFFSRRWLSQTASSVDCALRIFCV